MLFSFKIFINTIGFRLLITQINDFSMIYVYLYVYLSVFKSMLVIYIHQILFFSLKFEDQKYSSTYQKLLV